MRIIESGTTQQDEQCTIESDKDIGNARRQKQWSVTIKVDD